MLVYAHHYIFALSFAMTCLTSLFSQVFDKLSLEQAIYFICHKSHSSLPRVEQKCYHCYVHITYNTTGTLSKP